MIADKFIILWVTSLDSAPLKEGEAPSVKTLMYEFRTHNIYEVDSWSADADLIDTYRLLDAYNNEGEYLERLMARLGEEDKKRLLEELKPFIDTLDDQDNQMVVITRYK